LHLEAGCDDQGTSFYFARASTFMNLS
jgi:hypothetical protein